MDIKNLLSTRWESAKAQGKAEVLIVAVTDEAKALANIMIGIEDKAKSPITVQRFAIAATKGITVGVSEKITIGSFVMTESQRRRYEGGFRKERFPCRPADLLPGLDEFQQGMNKMQAQADELRQKAGKMPSNRELMPIVPSFVIVMGDVRVDVRAAGVHKDFNEAVRPLQRGRRLLVPWSFRLKDNNGKWGKAQFEVFTKKGFGPVLESPLAPIFYLYDGDLDIAEGSMTVRLRSRRPRRPSGKKIIQ